MKESAFQKNTDSRAAAQMQHSQQSAAMFHDNRPEALAQRRIQSMANQKAAAIQLSTSGGVIQRVGEQFVKAPGATMGARYVQDFRQTNLFDPSVNVAYTVHTSEQKHWLESYRTQEVTTPAAVVNTIATVGRNTFNTAFDQWVDFIIDYLDTNNALPPNGTHTAGNNPDFGTDAVGIGGNQVHSFPVAGNGAQSLTQGEYNALKLFARHYYGFGARTQVSYNTELTKVRNDNPAVITAYTLLGLTKAGVIRSLEREVNAYESDRIFLGYTFMGL